LPKPREIELADGTLIPILYEDRSVLVLDKPAGWLMIPTSWEKTGRNLQLALESSINAGDFWARSRNIKFLRFVHRLDAETSGAVLFVRSPGATRAYSELFESREVQKTYLAVVRGVPGDSAWKCSFPIAPVPGTKSRMQAVQGGKAVAEAKDAETFFRVLKARLDMSLLEARPLTGRTHQIRVHLAAAGHPVVGDPLYANETVPQPLGLRAVGLAYRDPFTKKNVKIAAPFADFVRRYQFSLKADELFGAGERPTKAGYD
jgi:RluA family pseudouridine synthase